MSIFKLLIFGIQLISLAWWMWADQSLRRLRAGSGFRIGLSLSVLVILVGFIWVFLERRGVVNAPIPSALYALVLLWGLIFTPLLGLPTMVGWALWMLARQLLNRIQPANRSGSSISNATWSRREWLSSALLSLPAIATYGTAAFNLPRLSRFRIREMQVFLHDLPEALDGMRIAQVTDTHVGKFTRGRVLDEIVAATNRLEADLILFTGDLIDNTIRDLPMAVTMLQKMRARSGVFVIEGNHDLFDDPAGFEKGVRDGGLVLLRNEAATVNVRGVPVQLLGIAWAHGEPQIVRDVETVARLRDPGAFPILLAHHPHAFDRAAELGFPLTLAGHTHGGQLMLTPELGAGPAMFRYWSGLYQKAGRALVVSNGTGNWFPLRLNAPAEIIHLTLRKG